MNDTSSDNGARAWSFDELVQQGLSMIPAYAPDWTNHNPSDPGITLIELLTYISEVLIYRALRTTPDAKLHFLRLLAGHAVSYSDLVGQPTYVIDEAVRVRVKELSQANCAVTATDFERLATAVIAGHLGDHSRHRVKCLPGIALRPTAHSRNMAKMEAPADVSVVVALEHDVPAHTREDLLQSVQEELDRHCLLTTRVHVAPAAGLHVAVACRISPQPGVTLAEAADAADAALQRRFDPLDAKTTRDMGAFGRTLHLAAIAGVIDRANGVDYVENVTVRRVAIPGVVPDEETLVGIRIGIVARLGEDTRLGGWASATTRRFQTDNSGEAEAVVVQPWEAVRVHLAREAVEGGHGENLATNAGGP